MLLRNISAVSNDCNGSRYVVREIRSKVIVLTRLTDGSTFFCFRVTLEPTDARSSPVRFARHQCPLRVCFACTIQKAQGQSLQRMGAFLPNPVFSHGALCVALSRASDPNHVTMCIYDRHGNPTRRCRNIVYQEVLRRQHQHNAASVRDADHRDSETEVMQVEERHHALDDDHNDQEWANDPDRFTHHPADSDMRDAQTLLQEADRVGIDPPDAALHHMNSATAADTFIPPLTATEYDHAAQGPQQGWSCDCDMCAHNT